MSKFQLPHVILPTEFITLLKSNLASITSPSPIFNVIRPNRALYAVLEKSFQEFDDGRGLEKTMMGLGWPHFREKMASVFIYKSIYGNYPSTTNMDLVDDIKGMEETYTDYGVNSFSRIFLLGFYLKLANVQIQRRQNNQFMELTIPSEVLSILQISQIRSEKIDWLILILIHLLMGLGEKMVMNNIVSGKQFNELYDLMPPDSQKMMLDNLLAYSLSIQEQDIFLYEKI